jgi:hypothetical protein
MEARTITLVLSLRPSPLPPGFLSFDQRPGAGLAFGTVIGQQRDAAAQWGGNGRIFRTKSRDGQAVDIPANRALLASAQASHLL